MEFEKLCRLLPETPLAKGLLGHVYSLTGKTDEARRILKDLTVMSEEDHYVSPFAALLVYLGLGEKDKVFEMLDKAYEDHSSYFALAGIKCVPPSCSPVYKSVRSDPRFSAMLSKLELGDSLGKNSDPLFRI